MITINIYKFIWKYNFVSFAHFDDDLVFYFPDFPSVLEQSLHATLLTSVLIDFDLQF